MARWRTCTAGGARCLLRRPDLGGDSEYEAELTEQAAVAAADRAEQAAVQGADRAEAKADLDGSAADAALRQKLYEAQLAEVTASRAATRSGATAAPDDTGWVIGAAAVGLLMIFLPLLLAGLGKAGRRVRLPTPSGFLDSLALVNRPRFFRFFKW